MDYTGTIPDSAKSTTANGAGPAPELEIPTAAEIFDRPPDPVTPIDYPDSPPFEIADRECARLIANCCFFNPPIEELEIRAYAERFDISVRQAELELRRERDED